MELKDFVAETIVQICEGDTGGEQTHRGIWMRSVPTDSDRQRCSHISR